MDVTSCKTDKTQNNTWARYGNTGGNHFCRFLQRVVIKNHFLYIYKKIAKCSGRKWKFLLTRPSPLATQAFGKLYLRKTRISRFAYAKESMETYPKCQRLYRPSLLQPAGRRIPPPRRIPLVPRVRERSFIF